MMNALCVGPLVRLAQVVVLGGEDGQMNGLILGA